MEETWSLDEAIEYYKGQEAPQNQLALTELLREVQEHNNGVLPQIAVEEIAERLQVKLSFLDALIKRYPSLRTEQAPHLIEICGGGNCGRSGSAELLRFIASEYKVQSGGISSRGGFAYRVVNCMKNCSQGPNVKWDGVVYQHMNLAKLKQLLEQ